MTPKIRRRAWLDMGAIGTLSIALAVIGQPRPGSLVAAGLGAITVIAIAAKELDR